MILIMENTSTHRSSNKAVILMAVAAAMPLGLSTMASAQSSDSLVADEIARRTLAVIEADKEILTGREAYAKGNFEEAVKLYRSATTKLPQGPIAEDRRQSYVAHLVDGSVALASQYRRIGRYDEARELLENVLQKDPSNALAKKQLEYLDDPIRTSPTLTYEHTRNVEKVRKLLYRGESYYNQAQFDNAISEYKEVLRIDPYNKAARRGMEKVSVAKSDYYRAAYDETRATMLMEVDRAWEFTIPPNLPTSQTTVGTGIEINENPALYLRRKLQRIQLENVDFTEDATVKQAIDILRLRARELDNDELDPNKKGLNFVFRDRGVTLDAGALDGDDGAGFLDTGKIENIKLGGLRLRNVPLGEALRQICEATGLRYKVENYSVVLMRATDLDDTELYTRTFRVPPDFKTLLDSGDSGGGGSYDPFEDSSGATAEKSAKELLEASGIPFQAGSSAIFSRARAVLTVRNSANNLDMIEALVEDIRNRKPKQIKLLTKFVEINQENTDELGFDWIISPFGVSANSTFLGGGTVGNGIPRTAADFGNSPIRTIDGIPAIANQNVSNTTSSGLRTGDYAVSRDSIDAFLNNSNRTAQSQSAAPGILALTGLFSESQVQMIMRGLSQKKGSDVMTAPSIVSRPGEKATIEIIREFIYPTEYEPPELPNTVGVGGGLGGDGRGGNQGGSIFPVTPATPTAFDKRNTGVTLNVEPGLGDDGYTIDLNFTPEIVEFEGFINYGSPIQSPATDGNGDPIVVTITENRIEMPVFSTRRVETALTIYDGHTVAVGGLMRENVQNVEDKVPILGDLPFIGRLFQSKSENRIKSNLIIFVTARIIDATGQPVNGGAVIIPEGNGSNELLPEIP